MSFCCSSLFALCTTAFSILFPITTSDDKEREVRVLDTPMDYSIVCVDEEDRKECQRFIDKLDSEIYFDTLMRSGACIACSVLGQCLHREFMEGPPVFLNLDRSSSQSMETLFSVCLEDVDLETASEDELHDSLQSENMSSKSSLLSKIDEMQRTLMNEKISMEIFSRQRKFSSANQLDEALAQLITELNEMMHNEKEEKVNFPKVHIEEGIETTLHLDLIVNNAVSTDITNLLEILSTNYSSFLEGSFGKKSNLLSRRQTYLLAGLINYNI